MRWLNAGDSFAVHSLLPDMNNIKQADLLDIALGLRMQIKGELPPVKPAAPVVVGEVLPRGTKEATLQRETAVWTERLRHTRGKQAAAWAAQLAEAELSHWSHWELEQQAMGHEAETHRNLDRVVGTDESGNDLTHHEVIADPSWAQQLAHKELVEVLQLHLTAKELDALLLRADGLAVPDRHCLKRAQHKAQAALRG
jgi:hypothetical protein